MVISKCVPLEISRKRFSDFTKNCDPNKMIFVGYKIDQDDGTKQNVQMRYEHIRQDIIKYIEENGGLGGGGGSQNTNPDGYTKVEVTDIFAPSLVTASIEDGQEVIIKNPETWDETAQSNIINLGGRQGCLEINGGGNYVEEYIMFAHPAVGSVTHVIVDNTGLPTGTGQNDFIAPNENATFDLYYGSPDETYGAELLIRVPYMHRGVVQILHTTNTDVIINTSCSQAHDKINKYVSDMQPTDDNVTNDPIDKTPIEVGNNFDIDMQQQKGYIEFEPKGHEQYTFWFSNPQLGSTTYIVIDNTAKNYYQDVKIIYGKKMDPYKDNDDITYEITVVGQEKAVIQVFHSLSADIIVKVTKV